MLVCLVCFSTLNKEAAISPNCWLPSNELHDVIFQKMQLFSCVTVSFSAPYAWFQSASRGNYRPTLGSACKARDISCDREAYGLR
jgi:hypothetical protein